MAFTEQEYQEMLDRIKQNRKKQHPAPPKVSLFTRKARGRTNHDPGKMNKTEAAYAQMLESKKRVGEILFYLFESMKFRLADRTWYTPDFMVQNADGLIEFHEVKGFWEDDARVKFKVVAEQFPLFTFKAVKKGKNGWEKA